MNPFKFPEVSHFEKLYGLIGYPLSHSFSKGYFAAKFANEGIANSHYEAFPIPEVGLLPKLFDYYPNLIGLNVTIPYKEQVIPHLDRLEDAAGFVQAVNTIKRTQEGLVGFNSDVYGFKQSLEELIDRSKTNVSSLKALILGTGGAAKAVQFVLDQLSIPFLFVSRKPKPHATVYDAITADIMQKYRLIINTTPLGMSPNTETFPAIPYETLSEQHLLFDLVYNPVEPLFLKKGKARGAFIQNGLDMLHYQAESSWAFWQK